jgi:hypothetical protein
MEEAESAPVAAQNDPQQSPKIRNQKKPHPKKKRKRQNPGLKTKLYHVANTSGYVKK